MIAMVNYCINTLEVSGPRQVLERFLYENKGENSISFKKSVEPPVDATTAWYVQNWGTSLDIDNRETDIMWDFSEDIFNVLFKTAWTPPLQWLFSVGIKYRDLSFDLHYEEPMDHYRGRFMITNGFITYDDYETNYDDFDD